MIKKWQDLLAQLEAENRPGWNLNTGKVITTLEDYSSIYHELFTYTIAFSFDGQLLASGDRDTTVKLWGILSPLTIE